MASVKMKQVSDLHFYRRSRGLTQSDLALLLGLTQQAIAKWEQTKLVPEHHIKELARHLRVPIEVILSITDTEGDTAQKEAKMQAHMNEFFSEQVVICFEDLCLHYCPSSKNLRNFGLAFSGEPLLISLLVPCRPLLT